MAFSLNKVMLLGNLGQDAETRFSNDNATAITTFTMATTRRMKSKDGEWSDETTWHNITAFNLSDYYKDTLKKGKKVFIEGRISVSTYNDRDGNKRTATKIVAENIIPLESRGQDSSKYSAPPISEPEGGSESIPPETTPAEDLPF
jgi:single-strand DNA-binding protein